MESWLNGHWLPAAGARFRLAGNPCSKAPPKPSLENEINGKLIATRLQQNQQALGGLLGESGEAATYGADGQRSSGASRRTLGSA
jgi:hypothetical protein